MMKLCAMWALLLLAGCVSLPADPTKMSAEQLREWAKDKNANISCGSTISTLGKFGVVSVVIDKGLVPNGEIIVDADCRVTIKNAVPVKP